MNPFTYLIMLAVYAIVLDMVAVYLNWRYKRQRTAASNDAAAGGAARPGA